MLRRKKNSGHFGPSMMWAVIAVAIAAAVVFEDCFATQTNIETVRAKAAIELQVKCPKCGALLNVAGSEVKTADR